MSNGDQPDGKSRMRYQNRKSRFFEAIKPRKAALFLI